MKATDPFDRWMRGHLGIWPLNSKGDANRFIADFETVRRRFMAGDLVMVREISAPVNDGTCSGMPGVEIQCIRNP